MENVVRLANVPIVDLVELRVVIESAAVRMASSASNAALADAEAAVATMRTPGISIDEFRAADVLFHRSLAA
ncbi:FCD domain-containing protein, partial [Acinetobacter baumannii]